MNHTLLNGAAHVSRPAVTVKVWRGVITAQELTDAGATTSDQPWTVIYGLLKLKGLPEHFLADGAPFKAEQIGGDLHLEFGGAAVRGRKH